MFKMQKAVAKMNLQRLLSVPGAGIEPALPNGNKIFVPTIALATVSNISRFCGLDFLFTMFQIN